MPEDSEAIKAERGPDPLAQYKAEIGPDGYLYEFIVHPYIGELPLGRKKLRSPPADDGGEAPEGQGGASTASVFGGWAVRGASPRSPTGPPAPASDAGEMTGGRRHD